MKKENIVKGSVRLVLLMVLVAIGVFASINVVNALQLPKPNKVIDVRNPSQVVDDREDKTTSFEEHMSNQNEFKEIIVNEDGTASLVK